MKKSYPLLALSTIVFLAPIHSSTGSNWRIDVGIKFFKTSLNNQPDELLYNPVFEKWEAINHSSEQYGVSGYSALEPYPFNFSGGVDALFRYRKYWMIKLGYCHTNTLGIGGKGDIAYVDLTNDTEVSESKEMSYSSHQINYFLGPLLPINDKGAEAYMGFSMMSPTYVMYKEKYIKRAAGEVEREYQKTFSGFFGNCRSVIGMQVPLTARIRFGSELVVAFFNGIELKSGGIADEGFRFPQYQWHFSFRYNVR